MRRDIQTTRNRRAPANVTSGPPGTEQIASLQRWEVASYATAEQLELLSRTIDEAEDERPLQQMLAEHPDLLATVTSGNHARYVLPKVRLGDRYEMDFALADLDSAGFHWTLVELESPTAKVAIGDGRLAEVPRHALGQIDDWRRWIGENLDTARRSRSELGTNLLQISSRAPGLIVGREGEVRRLHNAERERLQGENGIRLHSWDWLVREIHRGQQRGHGPLGWDDQLDPGLDFA